MPLGYASPVLNPPLSYEARRTAFVQAVKSNITPGAVNACFFPHRNDVLTSLDPITGKVWTYNGALVLQPRGKGTEYVPDGTTSYVRTPNVAGLSHGNATVDSAFSVLVAQNLTFGATRIIAAKWRDVAATAREWQFFLAGTLTLNLSDESATLAVSRVSDVSLNNGVPIASVGFTYDGTGGATAANGLVLYRDGAVIASTATNNAAYVAMEAGAAGLTLDGYDTGATFGKGPKRFFLQVDGVLTAAQMLALTNAVRTYGMF